MLRIYLVCLLMSLSTWAAGNEIIVLDTRDAYVRVVALKALFAEVDQRIRAARQNYETQAAPLQQQLEALKTSKMVEQEKRKQKARLLLQIAELQKQASAQQQKIGMANEAALKRFETELARISAELKAERKAQAVLASQDVLYYRKDCACNLTELLYQRINSRMPKLALEIK